jgi:hypothetical protein
MSDGLYLSYVVIYQISIQVMLDIRTLRRRDEKHQYDTLCCSFSSNYGLIREENCHDTCTCDKTNQIDNIRIYLLCNVRHMTEL